jgi:AbrB family looped-hinge helix DNA binding protein
VDTRTSADGNRLAALTAKVGPKGQIVIPKDIRDLFGIEPGDTVLVLADESRGIALQPIKGNESKFAQLFGAAFGPEDSASAAAGPGADRS